MCVFFTEPAPRLIQSISCGISGTYVVPISVHFRKSYYSNLQRSKEKMISCKRFLTEKQ